MQDLDSILNNVKPSKSKAKTKKYVTIYLKLDTLSKLDHEAKVRGIKTPKLIASILEGLTRG